MRFLLPHSPSFLLVRCRSRDSGSGGDIETIHSVLFIENASVNGGKNFAVWVLTFLWCG
jgi:hypothetical protein